MVCNINSVVGWLVLMIKHPQWHVKMNTERQYYLSREFDAQVSRSELRGIGDAPSRPTKTWVGLRVLLFESRVFKRRRIHSTKV